MSKSHWNGHEIHCIRDQWFYRDTGKAVKDSDRECGKCNKKQIDGHDACIANLPGVRNACCGHGTDNGYVQFENGLTIRGDFEIEQVAKACSLEMEKAIVYKNSHKVLIETLRRLADQYLVPENSTGKERKHLIDTFVKNEIDKTMAEES